MSIAIFLIQLLNGLQYGLLLFMLAAGLTLIFGIMNVVNLAHGSFYMLGAYLAWYLTAHFNSLAVAIVAGSVLALSFGAFLEYVLFRHFYKRDHLDQVLLTFGLILWFLRDSREWTALRGLLIGASVGNIAGLVVSAWATINGVMNGAGWLFVVTYGVLLLGYAYSLWALSQKASAH